jgi:hypothetical protein
MISGFRGNVNATVHPVFGWQRNVATKDQYPHENWTQWPPQPSLVHRLHISTCNPAVLQTGLYKLLFICSVQLLASAQYMNGICQLQILPSTCDSYFISKMETERTAVIKPRAICHQCPKNIPMAICCSVYMKALSQLHRSSGKTNMY